jgi:hypothetical protein
MKILSDKRGEHEVKALKACVWFMNHSFLWYTFLFTQSCIFYYIINIDLLITLYFYVCRWNMSSWNIKKKSIKKIFV